MCMCLLIVLKDLLRSHRYKLLCFLLTGIESLHLLPHIVQQINCFGQLFAAHLL